MTQTIPHDVAQRLEDEWRQMRDLGPKQKPATTAKK